MATSLTVEQVYNLVLDLVGETPTLPGIITPYSKWLNRNFLPTVERLIRSYNWNFARDLIAISVEADAPAFEWGYKYRIPSNWLRVLPPREGGYRDGRVIDHEIAGDYVYTNIGGSLKLRGLKRIEEPGRWDALFAALVQYDLALQMAHKFSGKASYVERLVRLRQDALELAEQTEAFEGDLEPIDDLDIIRARETVC